MKGRNAVIVVIAIVAIVLGIVITFVTRADQMVKRAIEEYGSAATQTKVLVDKVDIRLVSTAAGVHGLTVSNPPGFSVAPAVRLDTVSVALDASSIGSEVIVLSEVKIEAPQVYFEVDANRQANIEVIRRNVQRYGKSDDGDQSAKDTPSAVTPVPRKRSDRTRVIIKRLAITGGRVEIDATALGRERKVVELPDTEVTDIGLMSGGATGNEVAEVVVMALIRDVGTAVAAAQVQTKIEDALGGKAGKAVGKGVGDVIKGLGGVINDMLEK